MNLRGPVRIDLQPYADRCELAHHVAMTLYRHQGDDTSVMRVGRALMGSDAKKYHNENELIRYMFRNGLEQPFRAAQIQWEVEVPFALRKEFQTRGEWIFDNRDGDRYAPFSGKPYSFGIWTVNLWDQLKLMEQWMTPRMPREMRQIARHLVTVTRKWVPLCWEAWNDYVLHGAILSQSEIQTLRAAFEEIIYEKYKPHDINPEEWWRRQLVKRSIYGVEQDEFLAKMEVALWGSRQRRRSPK